jgi:hypothetical protein
MMGDGSWSPSLGGFKPNLTCFPPPIPASLLFISLAFASLLLDGFDPVQGTMEGSKRGGEQQPRHMTKTIFVYIHTYIMIIRSVGSSYTHNVLSRCFQAQLWLFKIPKIVIIASTGFFFCIYGTIAA